MNSFLQTDQWAEFKKAFGWQPARVGNWLSLTRGLPFGQKIRYWPELSDGTDAVTKLKGISGQLSRVTFERFEFLEPYSDEAAAALQTAGLVKAFEDVQPEYRQWLDIARPLEQILAEMKPKGRYNIRVAEKHQLETAVGTSPQMVEDFFQLYSFTAERTKFSGRDLPYFKKLMETLASSNVGEIILVKKSGQLLAGGIFTYYDGLASYLYGGSMGDRSLMAPYWLHYQAIQRAQEKDCQTYDLLAVAPPAADENHPYAGLSRFKTQFGGQTVHLLGSWDLVKRPFWYKMYRLVEARRRRKI